MTPRELVLAHYLGVLQEAKDAIRWACPYCLNAVAGERAACCSETHAIPESELETQSEAAQDANVARAKELEAELNGPLGCDVARKLLQQIEREIA
jgi:hypothetical protein